uniref:EF-hand domain-containing protein n=2 Tax=Percolomonas cosmopolitus TaxID=63605 RepID=A0A7S1KNC4_9EUKA|mmetsp:Transcript_2688/g.10319  ORF Transcript_2688/g.10319 Transcript_2688/m.10319 type:complete len:655 (+) Transcript_2688:562-2526(+)|eukprot:CAMPEP_0117444050 /NCGR_PEP_ID=MMETSP0759-20121206/5029_1 /TAXON_ID=63605 /ORGANISM="Percolomonas cosmopolitus, Strain WS" /LENGTH=654 /DNA_ID=CAMNT_0005236081 /DNA_START=554 /DNA_END=2518 /DNA_ORIENTATION=+
MKDKKTEDFTDLQRRELASFTSSNPPSVEQPHEHKYMSATNGAPSGGNAAPNTASQSFVQRHTNLINRSLSRSDSLRRTHDAKGSSFHDAVLAGGSGEIEYVEKQSALRNILCYCWPELIKKRPFKPLRTQKFLWNMFEQNEMPTSLGKVVNIGILIIIFISLLMFILGTEPLVIAVPALDWTIFAIEYLIAIIFTIEYVLRLYACVAVHKFNKFGPTLGRIRYCISAWGIIDLLAVGPSIFTLNYTLLSCLTTEGCSSSQNVDLRHFFVLRMFRLLRLGKLERQFKAIEIVRSIIKEKYQEITLAFISLLTCIVLMATLMYYAERDIRPDCFGSIIRSLYFVCIVISSVGLGDCTATTTLGAVITSIASILSILSVAIPTSILGSALIEQMARRKREQQQLRLKVRTKLQGMYRNKIAQRVAQSNPGTKPKEETPVAQLANREESEEMLTASDSDANSELSASSASDPGAPPKHKGRDLTRQSSNDSLVSYVSEADTSRSVQGGSRSDGESNAAAIVGAAAVAKMTGGGIVIACPFCQNGIDLNMKPKKSSSAPAAVNQVDDALQTFKEFDTDNSGIITLQQFRTGMKKRGVNLSLSDVRTMIREAGSKPENGINLRLFRKILHMGDSDDDESDEGDPAIDQMMQDDAFNWGI